MGAYNILISEISCPDCSGKHMGRIQFKFGNTFQFIYNVGEVVKWGGNDIGSPDLKNIKAYGIIESTTCPLCKNNNIIEEYDIFIENNIIKCISPIENIDDYLLDISEYVVLK